MRKYLFYLRNNTFFFKRTFSIVDVLSKIISFKGKMYLRKEDDMDWLTTYVPYLCDETNKQRLLVNLDTDTSQVFSHLIKKIQYLTTHEIVSDHLLFSPQDKKLSRDFAQYMLQYGSKPFAMNTFYLDRLQKKYQFKLDGKDILDFGACDGDTSIVFARQYVGSTVYAFEPEHKNYDVLVHNIRYHHQAKHIIPIHAGVGEKNEILKVTGHGAGANISITEGEEIEIITIDSFVDQNNCNPGLMKWDIEGAEYSSIVGAEYTIKKHKPILLISIYHTGKDFFEIKPLIESWNLGYKFGIERQHSSHPFADTLLICY